MYSEPARFVIMTSQLTKLIRISLKDLSKNSFVQDKCNMDIVKQSYFLFNLSDSIFFVYVCNDAFID